MTSDVYHVPFGEGETRESICEKTRQAFRAAGLGDVVIAGQLAAVKTHFGEEGNTTFVSPDYVKVVVDELYGVEAKPCLVETSTLYRGHRHNAADHMQLAVKHGFGPEAMGCPLVFVDGLRGNLHVEREVDLKHFKTVAVAGDFPFIPAAIVVTHLTGHILAGYAGAIKNVAMGLSSRAGKLRQHAAGHPEVNEEECIACGTCVAWCPEDAIRLDEKARIDDALCVGCGECVAVCPVGAVGFAWNDAAEAFNEKLAEYAYGILSDKMDRVGFLTFIHRTTKDCNCMGGEDVAICPDMGILASRDIVAIDQAAADLCNKARGGDVFESVRPGKHYTAQMIHGESIGLGSRDYHLITL